MQWFEGSISDAIVTAKGRKAIFVVYIDGDDEVATSMREALNTKTVTSQLDPSQFVAIKLAKDSEEHRQFAAIYKLVPVPSLFFIAQNGEPLEIVAGNAQGNPETRIMAAIEKCNNHTKGIQGAAAVPTKPAGDTKEAAASSSEQLVQEKENVKPEEKMVPEQSTSQPNVNAEPEQPASNLSMEEKVEIAKQLLAKNNELKNKLERLEEQKKEIERRRVGQELQKAKQMKQDLELKQLKEEREREKREEAEAKKRILEQIAQDRAERMQRMTPATSQPEVRQEAAPSPPPSNNSNIVRLQFKLPTGEAKSHSFPPETTLIQVRQFIDNNINLPFSEYQMATMFPRREFTHRDNNLDLRTLQLMPSAVILILPVTGGTVGVSSGGTSWSQVMINMFWDLLQPLFTVSQYVQSYLFGRPPPSAPSTSRQQPGGSTQRRAGPSIPGLNQGSGIRKRGNVHTLGDDSEGNDENNTWNGNSTQQM